MGQIVSIHSFRGGTGKTNISANVACLMAQRGLRVAVVDTDLRSPGLHIVFGLDEGRLTHTLSDFVFGKCDLEEAAYDLSADLGLEEGGGALFILPASLNVDAIMRVLHEGYDVGKLNNHFSALIDGLDLDVVILDSHPGLDKDTMLTTAVSDTLVIPLRPDNQDFHGTAALVEVAGRLGVPRVYTLANMVSGELQANEVSASMEQAFKYEVLGVLPLAEEMMVLGSRGLFVKRYPNHRLSEGLNRVVDRLVEEIERDQAK